MDAQKYNLVETVTAILANAGHQNPNKWKDYLDEKSVSKLPYHPQCYIVTEHLRGVVGPYVEDVLTSLTSELPYPVWVEAFKTHISDTMIKYDL